jgi:gamma-glutamyltranspeptidase/glutathione hydrolase
LLAEEESAHRGLNRRGAIYAARDLFYKGDIARRIADAVQAEGGLLTYEDLAGYRGRIEAPSQLEFKSTRGEFEVFKTGFWGQGPVLLQALALLQGFDLHQMGHNSLDYLHTVTEALKLAFADRDTHYGDPDFSDIPAADLLSAHYAALRRSLIDPAIASMAERPGNPWQSEPLLAGGGNIASPVTLRSQGESPDTTCVNAVDKDGNLFSSAPSSAWFLGGAFIAGDTGVPLGNRMQAFVLDENHPDLVQPGKRPRTTLSPTVVLHNGKPYLALSSPGGDSQDQQALQVFLNMAVFGMRPQEANEAPRIDSHHYHASFRTHAFQPGLLDVEDRIDQNVIAGLADRGHVLNVIGAFMMNTGTVLVGMDPEHGTLFGAADVRRQRFVSGR